jgi:hypothetical protein
MLIINNKLLLELPSNGVIIQLIYPSYFHLKTLVYNILRNTMYSPDWL